MHLVNSSTWITGTQVRCLGWVLIWQFPDLTTAGVLPFAHTHTHTHKFKVGKIGASIVIKYDKPLPLKPANHVSTNFKSSLLHFQCSSNLMYLENQWKMVWVLGPLSSTRKTQMEFQAADFGLAVVITRAYSTCWNNLLSSSLSFSLCLCIYL